MWYLEFLDGLHRALRPPTYLEIGIRTGHSLALSRCTSIGIDPAFQIKEEIACEVALFRITSDEYFERPAPLEPFAGRPIALSFVDGMHLFEYALRDFINVEKHADWTSVIVFDDMLPRSVVEAARERETAAWTGDVYKMVAVLGRYRPDLRLVLVDTQPTGLLLVLGADPENTVLRDSYDEIVAEFVTPDHGHVPGSLLRRKSAVAPRALLASPLWQQLADARTKGVSRRKGLKQLNRAVDDLLRGKSRPTGGARIKTGLRRRAKRLVTR